MATIPLRDYCREIEQMIDKGHTEEAIGHCRHILKHFPKHIDTYRLLGKSYLESRQLGDAADIFQRVLSSIPEDFVSHIGMSIIREDERNLDAAIWHMERAFEVQSSNLAIQDELKRLYANRDGQEPPKIRLTRGALAHMYAHGHLYSQAIAELRAALATDPKRLDLQVLLAKMYQADQQQANAAKTASQVLTKLPFCLEANKILAEILTQSQRAEEAAPHLVRVQELEPYYKHISPQAPTIDQVPSGVIVLEVLDWEATKGGLISQPAWATSIGVDISNAPASEDLPEWLSPSPAGDGQRNMEFGDNALSDNAFSDNAFSDNAFDDNAFSDNAFSDNAFDDNAFDDHLASFATPTQNWAQSSDDADQESVIESQPNEVPMMQEEDDNIPDWMKSAGWGQRDPNTPEEPPPSLFDDEEEPAEEGEIAKASIPDWLKAMAPSDEASLDDEDSGAAAADLPDWLEGFNAGETAPSRLTPSAHKGTPAAPSWLTDAAEEAEEPDRALPDWLADEAHPADAIEENAELPDWLRAPESEPASAAFNLDELEESTAPEWLQDFGDEAVEDILGTPKAETDTSETSWLDQLTQDAEEDPSLHSGVTDWLSTKEQEETGASALPTADVPDWLQDLGQELPESDELQPTLEASSTSESFSFEMSDLGKDADIAGEDLGLEDDAMAWLESLAAKQGAKEEELLIRPENRQDTAIPSWLEEITEDAEELAPEEEAVPDWLRGVTEEAEIEEERQGIDLGDTLKMEDEPEEAPSFLEELTAVETMVEETETPMEEDEEEGMVWLESLAAKHGAKEEELLTAPAERSEDVPEWLQGILIEDSEAPAAEIESPVPETALADLFGEAEALEPVEADEFAGFELDLEPGPAAELEEMPEPESPPGEASMDEDAALAWLESLAMKHGVNEEELLTDVETRPEETPDWVNVVAEEARAEEAAGLYDLEQAEPLEEAALEEEWMSEEASLEAAPATAGDDSTWLSDLLEDEEEPLPTPVEGVPDWITASTADLLAGMSSVETMEAMEEPVSQETELPDWLQEESIPEEAAPPVWEVEEPTEAPPAEGLEMPDWLMEEEPVEETPLPIFHEEAAVAAPVSGPVMEAEPEPEPVPEPPMEAGEALHQARATLSTGDVEAAAGHYEKLIKSNQNVDEAIADITEALNTRYPVDIGLWQTLGDAFVKKNKLQDALDAYTKAEELLR